MIIQNHLFLEKSVYQTIRKLFLNIVIVNQLYCFKNNVYKVDQYFCYS